MKLRKFTEALLDAADLMIENARTIIPGKVAEVTSDAGRESTVTTETGVGRRQGGEESSYGAVPNAPVLYPSGGGFSIRWPLAVGDENVAICSDRNIDRWRASREPGEAPTFARHHNASDALILPMAMTAPAGAPDEIGDAFSISGPAGECMRIVPGGEVTIVKQGAAVASITLLDNGSVTIVAASGQTVIIGDEQLAATLTKWPAWSVAFDAYRAALTAAGAGPAFAGSTAADQAYELAIGLNSPETSTLKGS